MGWTVLYFQPLFSKDFKSWFDSQSFEVCVQKSMIRSESAVLLSGFVIWFLPHGRTPTTSRGLGMLLLLCMADGCGVLFCFCFCFGEVNKLYSKHWSSTENCFFLWSNPSSTSSWGNSSRFGSWTFMAKWSWHNPCSTPWCWILKAGATVFFCYGILLQPGETGMLMILKIHKKCLKGISAGVDSSFLAAFTYGGWRSRVQKTFYDIFSGKRCEKK